ncbi:3-dehydro-L-gulonate 2-dehydrogenase [Granulicella rosea]|uniref:3-dehydro-L-gulonate 2-dehydrogenase n=1 Tax=Granulicella rosea TaxID=474952 RepID=A0A239HN04_9BACT|nr:3-dehydro-L-gulonate 2-dehydrogenase [Granulicella rosea]SNS82702.1 3-dehydro-L-gulonate 2-dehydrogenase [Granulicella rosea]
MLRVPYAELESALERSLLAEGFSPDRAHRCAKLFAETTCDGVYTHGLARFPRFLATVRNGIVNIHAKPVRVSGIGGLERWDGGHGPGNLNAWAAMDRAMTLARTHGIGMVALASTSHWMRGGSYGWQAANEGLFAICWSNTLPNLPAWGTTTPVLGNNPLVLAIPRPGGPVVVDLAMSQFSYGTMTQYAKRGAQLPVPGGYDTAGELTTDPAAIEASQRPLPIGFWKGSGLAMTLDLMAAMLTGNPGTHAIDKDPLREYNISQVFIAVDPSAVASPEELHQIAEGILYDLKQATPIDPARPARYPGEQTLRLREENLRLGVPVDPEIWAGIQ